MTRSHASVVEDQFGAQAEAYVASAVHAAGEDLDAIAAAAARVRPGHAIDLGAGGGHVAYRLADIASRVTAIDLSATMLEAVRRTAAERGLSNIETCAAPAEALPIADDACDFLACRFSAHHWRDFDAGLREARRVLRPGSTAMFVDVVAPGYPLFDTHLQAVELLRDPSHVRDYSESEWAVALDRAGFRVRATRKRRLRMEYRSWVERMRTPEPHRAAIRLLQQAASAETSAYFEIEPDGSFTIDTLEIEASVCRARSR